MDTKFYYTNEKGEKEEVKLERWMWGVVYNDNTELHQYEVTPEGEGVFHRVGEIDQSNVKLWVLKNLKTKQRIDILLPEKARIIHKYRRYRLNVGTKAEVNKTVYIFGYMVPVGFGKKHYHFNFVMPNDTIIQSINENPQLTNMGL